VYLGIGCSCDDHDTIGELVHCTIAVIVMGIDECRAGLRNPFLDLLRFGCCRTNKLWLDIIDCKLFDIVHFVEDSQHPFLPNISNSTCESAKITAFKLTLRYALVLTPWRMEEEDLRNEVNLSAVVRGDLFFRFN
jgi:hypothetical protein